MKEETPLAVHLVSSFIGAIGAAVIVVLLVTGTVWWMNRIENAIKGEQREPTKVAEPQE